MWKVSFRTVWRCRDMWCHGRPCQCVCVCVCVRACVRMCVCRWVRGTPKKEIEGKNWCQSIHTLEGGGGGITREV